MTDLLKLDFINSLPQPFIVTLLGGDEWPLIDICVETGLFRIDVCGKSQVMDIADANSFTDSDGKKHDSETFFSDYEEEQANEQ